MEMLNARNSQRAHLMPWHNKQAMQEYLKELVTGSKMKRKDYGTVMSTEANKDGLEQLAFQKSLNDQMNTSSTVTAYLAKPCVRKNLQVILEERVVKPSVPKLEGQVSFEWGSWTIW